MNFISVNEEFREYWDNDAVLDSYLASINDAVRNFQMACVARELPDMRDIFRPTCLCSHTPILSPK